MHKFFLFAVDDILLIQNIMSLAVNENRLWVTSKLWEKSFYEILLQTANVPIFQQIIAPKVQNSKYFKNANRHQDCMKNLHLILQTEELVHTCALSMFIYFPVISKAVTMNLNKNKIVINWFEMRVMDWRTVKWNKRSYSQFHRIFRLLVRAIIWL